MKKLLIAAGLGLISGSLYAACMGPYCYDDTGASINAAIALQSYNVLYSTNTNFVPYTPFVCTNCGQTGYGLICISTGTGKNAVVVSSAPANKCIN